MSDEMMNDDELGSEFRGRVPEPQPDYWDEIDASLAAAQEDVAEASEDSSDTDAGVIRLTDMTSPTAAASFSKTAPLLALAAAIVLIVGIGGFVIFGGTGSDTVDVAESPPAPVNDPEPLVPPTGVPSPDIEQPSDELIPVPDTELPPLPGTQVPVPDTQPPSPNPVPDTPPPVSEPVAIPEPASDSCGESTNSGDLDGDGEPDRFEQTSNAEGVFCMSDGQEIVIEIEAWVRGIDMIDIDGDGLFEMLYFASNPDSNDLSLFRLVGSELMYMGGYFFGVNANYRCADVDGDGLIEILQGSIDIEQQAWTVETFKIEDDVFVEIEKVSGNFVSPPDPDNPSIRTEEQAAELSAALGYAAVDDPQKDDGCS